MPEQVRFKTNHSTQHQLLCVVKSLNENLNMSTPAPAIFLDAAKAFDKVWRKSLSYLQTSSAWYLMPDLYT